VNRQKLAQQMISIGLVLFFLVGCSAPATPTPVPPTPTPGIGVPVTGGNWEITITDASKTTEWKTYTAKSGFVFVVLKVIFHNLETDSETIVSTPEMALIDGAGKIMRPGILQVDELDFLNGDDVSGKITGFSCVDCAVSFGKKGSQASATLVFGLEENVVDETFKFQFHDAQIPFLVK
jgi:hypothetical protein